ncbi:SWIM zinc finger family protein [Bacillus mesophilum]|uniref:SWIM zinc finger family protein n=1 Tax=Bacillus mesophilum TaxID=1071718 RepID=A0A7V7UV66_9BACI|nr:SWIM zinc finger family protein [Bacillus mesophilum]KAB2332541.1 SWIM zinc finger family protein [Bacillus mesophilum]
MRGIPEHLEEPLQLASQELKGMLHADAEDDVKLVHKGLMLYRQGLVGSLSVQGETISAVVQDVTPANVLLNLDFFSMSECSCPADGFCRHQMAVFLQLLSRAHSVSEWVEEWRRPLKEMQDAKGWGLQKARDLLKTAGMMKPSYDKWIETFEISFEELFYSKGIIKPYIIPEIYSIYIRRLRAGAPAEREWRLLYELIGSIYTFRKLADLSQRLEYEEAVIHRYYGHVFQSIMDDVFERMRTLSAQSFPFAFDEFIERMKVDSIEILKGDVPLEYERIHLYRILWTTFFTKKNWRQDERERLQESNDSHSFSLSAAAIHIDFLLRQDEDALRALSEKDPSLTTYMLYWIETLNSQKDWKRAGLYLEVFISKLHDYLQQQPDYYTCRDFTRLAIKVISPFCTETGSMDLFERALEETLPYSYNEYEYLLFENQEYEKWGDLQAYIGFDMGILQNDRIKTLEKADPIILLPLYHHGIQSDIDMKNRDHYKAAVRKMKKLRTLYKKLKRMDDWSLYLDEILLKTKRLRAFQEECKRGKLIDA